MFEGNFRACCTQWCSAKTVNKSACEMAGLFRASAKIITIMRTEMQPVTAVKTKIMLTDMSLDSGDTCQNAVCRGPARHRKLLEARTGSGPLKILTHKRQPFERL